MIPGLEAYKRIGWQMPADGLPDALVDAFWKHVDIKDGHWFWTGQFITAPTLRWDEHWVGAHRISWGLKHGSPIPQKLYRNCEHARCVNPDCYSAGKQSAKVVLKPKPPVIITPEPPAEVNPVVRSSQYRTLEAMGAIQFGLPVVPRTLPALRTANEAALRRAELNQTDVEIIDTHDGDEVLVERPRNMQAYVPNAAETAAARKLTLKQVLEIIFEPGTTVMTFKTGHTWLIKPNMKLDADSAEELLNGYLILTGAHAVHE